MQKARRSSVDKRTEKAPQSFGRTMMYNPIPNNYDCDEGSTERTGLSS
jgi:hypothetical protein